MHRAFRTAAIIGLGFGLIGMLASPATAASPPSEEIRKALEPVPGRYIVVFNEGVDAATAAPALAARHDAKVTHVYRHALQGFAAGMSEAAAVALLRNPNVAFVEEDGIVRAVTTQNNAPWGLDRIDQRDRPLNGTYVYEPTGSGVTAYVIDTGIRITHTQFGGRAVNGTDTIDGDSVAQDCNGHGTHVAGTIGGSTYGVAKSVSLVAVRVLNCQGSGTVSSVVGGVDWVTGHHTSGPAVANMSLGGGASSTIDNAVQASINDGVGYAVAAGNGSFPFGGSNACNSSPARLPAALTVGATNTSDAKPSFSNYGSCLDLFAPGDAIISAWNGSDSDTNTISGTSMASPHVAGTAALYLQGSPSSSPATVHAAIVNNATTGRLSSIGSGSPNRLLYMAFLNSGGGDVNNPPTASFTFSCAELACDFNASGSSDSDGTISGYAWNFGDGSTGSGVTTSRTYAAGGTYAVTLTVTDNDGATGQSQQNVTVSSGGGGGFSLSASGSKVKGVQHADLTWSGASSTSIDVFRDGAKITTTANDGAHTDNIGKRGGGSYTYKLCEAGTTTCSNVATVTF